MFHQRGEFLRSLHGSRNASGDVFDDCLIWGLDTLPNILPRPASGRVGHPLVWANIVDHSICVAWSSTPGVRTYQVENEASAGAFFLNEMQKICAWP